MTRKTRSLKSGDENTQKRTNLSGDTISRAVRKADNAARSRERRKSVAYTIQDLRNAHREAHGKFFVDHMGGERRIQTHGHPVLLQKVGRKKNGGIYAFVCSYQTGNTRTYFVHKFATTTPEKIVEGENRYINLGAAQAALGVTTND